MSLLFVRNKVRFSRNEALNQPKDNFHYRDVLSGFDLRSENYDYSCKISNYKYYFLNYKYYLRKSCGSIIPQNSQTKDIFLVPITLSVSFAIFSLNIRTPQLLPTFTVKPS